MVLNIFLLILGLILLVVASNLFVDSASSLANNFKLPKMVIALTIASFCTCTPELSISFSSILNNNYDVTLSNVIGSCVVNILLIIGIASIVKPIKIKTSTVSKELPLLVITTVAFSILFIDGNLSRIDAAVLLLLFIIFCLYLYKMIKRFKNLNDEKPKYSKAVSIILIIVSLIVIYFSGELVINSTLFLSEKLNISTKLISMVVIVIGTSLPELVITVTSAKKGEFDMTVGNIVGTNIFNICIVLGLPVLIFGTVSSISFSYIDFIAITVSALLFYFLGKSDKKITRFEGIIMVSIFISYYLYLFIF